MKLVPVISAATMMLVVVIVAVTLLAGRGQCPTGTAVALDGLQLVAGPISTSEQTGSATYYGNATAGGACGFPTPPANGYGTAVGPVEFAGAAACGTYLQVTGPLGTVTVKVTNLCPECGPGHLDLNNEAFARIGDPVQGKVPITYHAIENAAVPGPTSVYVKEGSSQWWLALLIDNHANPLASVEVSATGGAWAPMRRVDYGFWLADSGAGPGPVDVRVTDVLGKAAVLSGIRIEPQTIQTPGAQPQAAAPPAPAPAPTVTVDTKTPVPATVESSTAPASVSTAFSSTESSTGSNGPASDAAGSSSRANATSTAPSTKAPTGPIAAEKTASC